MHFKNLYIRLMHETWNILKSLSDNLLPMVMHAVVNIHYAVWPHSRPSTAEVDKEWRYSTIATYALIACTAITLPYT